jgi:hypothetical protein
MPEAFDLRRLVAHDRQMGREPGSLPLHATDLPIVEIARAIQERAEELGLTWRLVPATVAPPGPNGQMRVVYDGDTEQVDAVSMIGRLPVGGRVFVIVSPPAGVHIVGFIGYDFPPSVTGEAIGRPRLIATTADFDRASTTVAQVPGMSFTAVPGAAYLVQLRASLGGTNTVDGKVSWTAPVGATVERYVLGLPTGETNNYAAGTLFMGRRSAATEQQSGTFGGGPAGSSDYPGYWEDIYVRIGAAGGTVGVQFARVAASGTATFRSSSFMTVQRYR